MKRKPSAQKIRSVRDEAWLYVTTTSLIHALELKDRYMRGHSERVATYAVWFGQHVGFSGKRLRMLQYCARLHDIGKIGVTENILCKPGALTIEERAEVELHPVYGSEIAADLAIVSQGLPFILHHHERYDGRGYPCGLRGEQIPLEARILGIVDAFDAMTSDRPYRRALTIQEAVEEFKKESGKQFDPRLVRKFLEWLSTVPPRKPQPGSLRTVSYAPHRRAA